MKTNNTELDSQMFKAAGCGDAGRIKELLEAGADVNARDHYRNTPLHKAVSSARSVECCALLIEAGADIEAENMMKFTPVIDAVAFGTEECLNLLIKAGARIDSRSGGDGSYPIHKAASHLSGRFTSILLAAGADPNACDRDRNRPLHVAAVSKSRGSLENIRLLLAAGADINAVNIINMAPLHWAAQRGYMTVVKKFIKAGADLEIEDNMGRTAMNILKEKHPDKYSAWTIQKEKRRLKNEDKAKAADTGYEFDI